MNMKKKTSSLAIVFLLIVSLFVPAKPASAIDLGDIIGVVGGGLIVGALADEINDFINTVTLNRGAKNEDTTKVVPIVSLGQGARIGAAQVSGPKDAVEKTKAVAQLEVRFKDRFRIEILIPVDSANPIKSFRRVQKVGLSALVDYKL